MLPHVVEDVHEGIPDLARRSQHVCVESVGPDAPTSPEHAIDRLRGPDGQPLHAAREPRRCIRLHQQVQMVGLDAELKKPESVDAGGSECALEACKHRCAAERAEPRARTEGHMHWVARVVERAATMRHRTPAESGPTPGSFATATPSTDGEIQLPRGL